MGHQWKILVVTLLLASGSSLGAEVNVGIKGGGSIQHLWGREAGFSGMRLGGGGGFFIRAKPVEIFGIQLEILYAMKGGKVSMDAEPYTIPSGEVAERNLVRIVKLQYLEIPLLFKFYAPGFKNADPNVFIGPYYGYLLGRKKKDECSQRLGSSVDDCDEMPPETDIPLGLANDHDFGLVLGVGIDFGLGTFDLRYTIGLKTIEEETDDDSHTGTLSVMFGFLAGI